MPYSAFNPEVIGGGGGGSPLVTKDEGVILTSVTASLDFVGAGVTATQIADAVTITIPGGGGGGSGTVTSFSAGDLVPIFTTTEADPTTTPALTFVLTNAGAHQFLGNNTGAPAAPAYIQPSFSDLAGTFTLPQSPSIASPSLIGRGTSGVGIFEVITLGTNLTMTGTTLDATDTHAVTFAVDGVGQVLSAGVKNPIKIPYGGSLLGWTLIANPSGSVTVDVLRAVDGAGLPVTSIIGAGAKPSLSSAVENSGTSFGSWTSTTLTAKDNMAISLSGITNVTYLSLILYFQ